MEVINPQLKELEQKYSELQNVVSHMRGEALHNNPFLHKK